MSSNLNNVQNVSHQSITTVASSTSSGVVQHFHQHHGTVYTGGAAGGQLQQGGSQGGSGVASKDNSKSLNDRFKAFFKGLAKTPATSSAVGVASSSGTAYSSAKMSLETSPTYVLLTPEILADLAETQPLPVRIRALQSLIESCKSKRIESHTIEKLWTTTSDLFQSTDTAARHICFHAFTTIILVQVDKPGFLRAKLFSLLKSTTNSEDTYHRFQLLKALSDNGRNLSYFEEKVGPFLFGWMVTGEVFATCTSPTTVFPQQRVSVEEFMVLLTNVVKFNCSFLDDDVLGGIIQYTCITALTCSMANDAIACINLLSTIISYSMIPPNTLQIVVATLCRTVNSEPLCSHSWKVMRYLLGTPLGPSGLYTLIQFMNGENLTGLISGPNLNLNNMVANNSGGSTANADDGVLNKQESGGGLEITGFNTGNEHETNSVIRGAVFYSGVVLWGGGNKVIRSLSSGSTSGGTGGGIFGVVLGAYERTLARSNPLIIYEVLLRVQDLIKNSADSVQVIGWDLILEIMRKIIDYSKQQEYQASIPLPNDPTDEQIRTQQQLIRNNQQFLSQIHDTLDLIETILPTKTFCGDINKYWEHIVEPVCHFRPIHSIEKLLKHKHTSLLNSTTLSFNPKLVQFALLHFQKETRTPIRLQALAVIKKICLLNQDTMEESLLDNVILPNLKTVENEQDISIRQDCVKFIVDFLMESRSKKGHDLLHYVEKVVNRPYELEKNEQSSTSQPPQIYSEADVKDVLVGITGIIQIFQRKIYSLPSSIAVTAFKILVRHLEKHYKTKHNCLENCSTIRYKIFECFFKIRANALYHLGFPNEEGIIEAYSSYLAVDHRDPREGGSNDRDYMDNFYPYSGHSSGVSPPIISAAQAAAAAAVATSQPQDKQGAPMVSFISLTAACKQVICCLKKERDWKILELVLQQLPNVMENKALILSKHGNDVDLLASHLCIMVKEAPSNFPSSEIPSLSYPSSSSYRNTPPRFSRSDFQSCVFPALTSLVSYHSCLETKIQQQIVKCLEHGLVSKSSRICISALTTCTLEMKEVMHKLIPEILLSLSKITPKPNIAIPVLEFLSTLIHLPRVFASFVQDQYMSIFAICLPYTNPFKFNPYVVSLAHHVIALWFLKCRLSFRKGFVTYIIKNLETNVWAPYHTEVSDGSQLVNEDSSNRKRSSSLTDQSNRRRERMVSGHTGGTQALSRQASCQPMDTGLMQFHHELTETCVDLMARYAFADCSPLPSRFESAGFLTQHGGNTQSWMIDNRIITISTSGCSQRELREGLCDRCWVQCRQMQPAQGHSKRSLLVGQHSYDEQDVKEYTYGERGGLGDRGVKRSNTISGSGGSGCYSGSGALRRRHKSAMVQQQQLQHDDSQKHQHHDDLHLEHKLSSDAGRGLSEGGGRIKKDGAVCMCWCQGWAEILIRRPTGNTSWMMRVQNLIGGGGSSGWPQGAGSGDRLVSNLCAMYVNDIVSGAKQELEEGYGYVMAGESSGGSSRMDDGGSGDEGGQSKLESQSTVSSSSDIGPERKGNGVSDEGSKSNLPEQERNGHASPVLAVEHQQSPPASTTTAPAVSEEELKKTPVKRSNSSPEVAKGSPGGSGGVGEEDEAGASASGTEKQKQNNISTTYLSSCDPIPEESSRRSESESEVPSVNVTVKSVSASSSPPPTPQSQHLESTSLTPVKRDRIFTISVMSPASQSGTTRPWRNSSQPAAVRRIMGSGDITRPGASIGGLGGSDPGIRSGISPSFIFLQLCGQGIFGNHTASKPRLLPAIDSTTTSLKVLDYIPPYETHKIGVLYVGPGQAKNETDIFQNSHGSLRYIDFLQGLGTLIKLNEVDPQKTFLGGLDGKGEDDGEFACIWKDDVMQVIFHVATFMPTRLDSDPQCNKKKRHIGNDFVAIIYNNSDEEFDISTIKCQFLYACVIIQPLDHRTNRVYVKAKPALAEQISPDVKIVSDLNLPIMARQLALHSNLASVIYRKLSQNSEPYASNWLERLRAIKRLRARLFPDSLTGNNGSSGGLSSSTQELSDSVGGAPAAGTGSTGNVGTGSSSGASGNAPNKRNSFGVDDFTEYV